MGRKAIKAAGRKSPPALTRSKGAILLSYGGSLLCGCLFALPVLLPALWFLSWVTTTLLLAIVSGLSPRRAFKHGWCFGFAVWTCGIYWLPRTITEFAGFSLWLSILLICALNALVGMQYGFFGYMVAKLDLRGGRAVMLTPVVWVALEYVWPGLFPWRLGQAQVAWLSLIQIAEFTGVFGISFLVMWVCALVYQILRVAWIRNVRPADDPGASVRKFLPHLVCCGLVFVAVLSFGAWRIGSIEETLASRPKLRVALIQPGRRNRVQEGRQRSRAIQGRVDLICWPESAIGGFYSLDLTEFGKLDADDRKRPFADPQCHLLFGASSHEPDSPKLGPHYNSAILLDKQERIIGRYHKRILMPFGEYIPGEQWFPFVHDLFFPFDTHFAPGASSAPLAMDNGAKLGTLICYEDVVSRLARDTVRAGADVLVNLTNDMWFGTSAALAEHQQLALLRTIENRRYLLRCTLTGSTSIISPTGRIVAQAPVTHPATLEAVIHRMDTITFYTRWGDVFAWCCVVIVVVVAIRQWRANRKMPAVAATPRRS